MIGLLERHRTLGSLGCIASLAILLGVLTVGGPPDDTFFWDSLFDAGHAVLFAFVMGLCFCLAHLWFPSSPRRTLIRGFVATLAIGAASELAQRYDPARQASVGDFLRDAAGAAVFSLAWLSLRPRVLSVGLGRFLRVVACCMALVVATPLLVAASVYVDRDRSFPVLMRLDGSRWESYLVHVGHSSLGPHAVPAIPGLSSAGAFARLTMQPGRYPGFVLDEPYPDWRGFQRLVFTVVGEEEAPLILRLRINDRWHNNQFEDRFNTSIEVRKGVQQIAIPLEDIRTAPSGRVMDLSQIRAVAVYAYRLNHPARVYFGAFRLE